MAVTRRGEGVPLMRQIVVQPRAGVEGVKGVRLGPRLLAQHRRRKDFFEIGHSRAAQQLISADRALHLVLVLEVAFQDRLRAELPIRRARAHAAPAVGVVHVAHDLFAGQIHARAHLLLLTKKMSQIDRAIC